MWLQYKNENSGSIAVEDQENDDDNNEDEAPKRSFVESIVVLGNTLIIILIAVGYPTAVLPIYLAEKTSEYVINDRPRGGREGSGGGACDHTPIASHTCWTKVA